MKGFPIEFIHAEKLQNLPLREMFEWPPCVAEAMYELYMCSSGNPSAFWEQLDAEAHKFTAEEADLEIKRIRASGLSFPKEHDLGHDASSKYNFGSHVTLYWRKLLEKAFGDTFCLPLDEYIDVCRSALDCIGTDIAPTLEKRVLVANFRLRFLNLRMVPADAISKQAPTAASTPHAGPATLQDTLRAHAFQAVHALVAAARNCPNDRIAKAEVQAVLKAFFPHDSQPDLEAAAVMSAPLKPATINIAIVDVSTSPAAVDHEARATSDQDAGHTNSVEGETVQFDEILRRLSQDEQGVLAVLKDDVNRFYNISKLHALVVKQYQAWIPEQRFAKMHVKSPIYRKLQRERLYDIHRQLAGMTIRIPRTFMPCVGGITLDQLNQQLQKHPHLVPHRRGACDTSAALRLVFQLNQLAILDSPLPTATAKAAVAKAMTANAIVPMTIRNGLDAASTPWKTVKAIEYVAFYDKQHKILNSKLSLLQLIEVAQFHGFIVTAWGATSRVQVRDMCHEKLKEISTNAKTLVLPGFPGIQRSRIGPKSCKRSSCTLCALRPKRTCEMH